MYQNETFWSKNETENREKRDFQIAFLSVQRGVSEKLKSVDTPDDTLCTHHSMSVPVTCLEVGANIRGARRKGVQVIKKSITEVGFSKSSFIKCYEVFEEGDAEESILDHVAGNDALRSLDGHQRWVTEDMEVTKK